MLKLIQTKYGQFDLDLLGQENVGLEITKSVVYGVLFTDQQAQVGRVEDPYDQRGWWFEKNAGTGLWYVRRQARSNGARAETVAMIVEALSNYPGMLNVEVTDTTLAGNISQVEVDVVGTYDGVKFHVVVSDALLPEKLVEILVWTEPWTEPWTDSKVN